MKNIIDEKPTDLLNGRTLYSTKFVSNYDIKNKIVLDVGCGFGWFELNALELGCKKIIGMELSNNDLLTAKKYVKNKKALFKIGSAIKLPFKSNFFDTVVSWEVIEHILKGTENKMFNEINRVLKPKGVFYLSTPNKLSSVFDPAWWLIGHRHYSKDFLIDLAENNGFKLSKMIIKGGFWEIISIINLYISKWVFRRKPFFNDFVKNKVNLEYNHKGVNTIFMKFRCKK